MRPIDDIGEDPMIGPPFKLCRKSLHCTRLIGTVGGKPGRFITSMNARQTILFNELMVLIGAEAKVGAFTTKGDAIKRRFELLLRVEAAAPVDTAEHADTFQ